MIKGSLAVHARECHKAEYFVNFVSSEDLKGFVGRHSEAVLHASSFLQALAL